MTRLIVAETAGFLIGVLAFALMPLVMPEIDPMVRWGVVFWYPTMAAIIAMAEGLDLAGGFKLALPWWLRGALIGAWMNLLATLFAHDVMRDFLGEVFGPDSMLANPFWFVAEGALVGIVIGYMVVQVGAGPRGLSDD